MLALLAPDGSYIGSGQYGRGTAGLNDPTVSSKQFSVSTVDGMPDILLIENLGTNRASRPPTPACSQVRP